ncbi:MAG: hypothetical protein LBT04_09665 [Prevotellaceae bacterium]|jgi:hypothetical protein|nr:hypothetical protein [Prevotellaceae bacterium]
MIWQISFGMNLLKKKRIDIGQKPEKEPTVRQRSMVFSAISHHTNHLSCLMDCNVG